MDVQKLQENDMKDIFPGRLPHSHKGMFGKVFVMAGSMQYPGSAYLCGNGAYRVGAGLVTLLCEEQLWNVYASSFHEATYAVINHEKHAPTEYAQMISECLDEHILLLGPGLGQSEYTRAVIVSLLGIIKQNATLVKGVVIDADGLNNLSKEPMWWKMLPDNTIITPHIGEMKRLSGENIVANGREIPLFAQDRAKEWHTTIVLKQSQTVIANYQGKVWINEEEHPLLATAGTGDVLAGMIAGFLAQGISVSDAARLGVFIHSQAAKHLTKEFGESGMLASDLLSVIPVVTSSIRK